MTDVVFYFQVHQPCRLRHDDFLARDGTPRWFDDDENRRILRRVSERCYLPMNALIAQLIEEQEGRFRCSFSVSGTALEQMRRWSAETIGSFAALAETGCVEFLAETSHHSLASIIDEAEFEAQVRAQCDTIAELFGQTPKAFRNTECVISEPIARTIERLGFDVMMGEGADHLLGWRKPYWPYRPRGCEHLKLLLRCYPLSDDIGFRFSNREWPEWPLPADRFAGWLHELPEDTGFVGLYMDYETFGEHQGPHTGLFEFMRHLPSYVLDEERFEFRTPSETAARLDAVAELPIARPTSWADEERDLTAWLGNPMQRDAHAALYAVRADLARLEGQAGAAELLPAWRDLSTSDHVYYMCTKFESDGDVHEYFSPYPSPHDAYVNFMNVVDDIAERVRRALGETESGARSESVAPGRHGRGAPAERDPEPSSGPGPERRTGNRKPSTKSRESESGSRP